MLTDFVDHYFPEDNLAADTLEMSSEKLARFTGSYRGNRYPHKRFTYVMALLGTSNVTATNSKILKTMEGEDANFWFPVDSLTFRNTKNSKVITFEENDEGQITHMYRGGMPIMAFEKVSFISSQKLHFTLFGLAVGAFLVTLFYWPMAYGIRRKYRPKMKASPPLAVPKKAAAWVNALTILIFFIWMGVLLGSGNGQAIVYGISAGVKAALILPIISVALTLVMTYYTFTIWYGKESGIWSRLCYTLLTLLSMTLLWQLNYWNLLGFQY